MRATAEARPNIALIKYWGKRDTDRNLPSTGSLSITLDALCTRMTVELDPELAGDALTVNGKPSQNMLPRVSRCLDQVLGEHRVPASISSSSNFPIAAGLASSASAFAALVVAADAAAGLQHTTLELARTAGGASGSAARSLYGGFVELQTGVDEIKVKTILAGAEWPLQVVVAINAESAKPISSGEAMTLSAQSSPFYAGWVEQQDADLDIARAAVLKHDFASLGAIAEHNCLKMHSVMWSSRPAIVYWNAATIASMETVRQLRAAGLPVFFTIDAGPQVKAVCTTDVVAEVQEALSATPGVIDTMCSSLGAGAAALDNP